MSPAERIAEIYETVAADYERARSRAFFERPYLERVLAQLAGPSDVLDLGCGCGEPIARFFIEAGHRVTGVDVAEAMLARCRARFAGHAWIAHDMRSLNLKKSFGAIIAWDSFFHLPPDDQRAMFPVFARHAAPGAALLFTSGSAEGVSLGQMFGHELYHASLATAEYERLLSQHGFAVSLHRVADPQCGEHTVWLALRRANAEAMRDT
jgi:cyclopropane fatty-acyl-phospholipid synthase-like methyltransferase